MTRPLLELVELREEGVDEASDPIVALGLRRPLIGAEHGSDSERVHGLAVLDELRVILARQCRWKVLVGDGIDESHGKDMEALAWIDPCDERDWFCRH